MGKLVLVLMSVGCSFNGANPGDRVDAGENDAAGDCDWGDRAFFDPCGEDAEHFQPINEGLSVLSLPTLFDTTSGEFVMGADPGFRRRSTTLSGNAVYLWVVDDLTISSNVTVIGDRPLLIAAFGTIDVTGSIDVSSRWEPDEPAQFGGAFVGGAGAGSGACLAIAGEAGMANGGGGGGGGGFGSAGGAGGAGGEGSGGTAGPVIGLDAATSLRGGCAGGRGGAGTGGMPAPASPGGGGLLLSAIGLVEIGGTLASNGAGGVGQFVEARNGGGGAGSGGMIAIQAPTIEVTGNLFANGGGGGGGANGNKMTASGDRVKLVGENGRLDESIALGAEGEAGGVDDEDGGDGAALGVEADDGSPSNEGGGGGGGGVGYIILINDGATVTNSPSSASPSPTIVGLDLQPL